MRKLKAEQFYRVYHFGNLDKIIVEKDDNFLSAIMKTGHVIRLNKKNKQIRYDNQSDFLCQMRDLQISRKKSQRYIVLLSIFESLHSLQYYDRDYNQPIFRGY